MAEPKEKEIVEKGEAMVGVMIYVPKKMRTELNIYCQLKGTSVSSLLRKRLELILEKARESDEKVSFSELVARAAKEEN